MLGQSLSESRQNCQKAGILEIFSNVALMASLLILSSCGMGGLDRPSSHQMSENGVTLRRADAGAGLSWIRSNIFEKKCMDCHSEKQGDGDGLKSANFDTYEGVMKVVTQFHPEISRLYVAIESKKMPKGMDPMPGMPNPPPATPLSPEEQKAISDWILAGAPNN